MLDDVIPYLACPYCGDALRRAGGTLSCGAGHSFDISRQGYVSLLPAGARGGGGDTAAMVAARAGFLAAGHFGALAADLAGTVAAVTRAPGCVADIGAGTGYFLAAVVDRLPERVGLALDVSKFALRQAARAHPRLGAVGADVWRRLPVADQAAAVALSVFAPRHGTELRRILHPSGRLVVVTPDPAHLAELVGPLGLLTVDPRKDERLAGKLADGFVATSRHSHVTRLRLGHDAAAALVAMGPSARHVDAGRVAAGLAGLPAPVPVTVAVTVSVYRVRAPADVPRGPGRDAAAQRAGSQPIDLTTASSSPGNEAR